MNNLLKIAEKARQSSQFRAAEKSYRAFLRKSILPEDKAEGLLGLADVERIQGFFTKSLMHYQQASLLFQKLDQTAVKDAQVGWALAARAVGRPMEALCELKKALVFYQSRKDIPGQAFAHWALGGTLRISGDMKAGLQHLQTALRMFKKIGDSEGISYTCCALGGIFRMLGRYAESGKYYREASRRMRQRKDTFGIAYSYCGLGNVQRMAGRFKQALPFYKKAEKLYGTIGDRVSYAYTLWSIGTTYKMLGLYTQAHWAFYKADNLFKKTGDTRGRIYALLGFAEAEWMKANQHPTRSHEATKKGNKYWKGAMSISKRSKFAWEKLHVESLKGGRINLLASRYQKTGSKFYPTSLPINWP